MRFQYTIHHVPGKTLYTADTLSRAPVNDGDANTRSPEEIKVFVREITAALPADSDRLHSYSVAQAEDSVCSKLIQYCQSGWPK